MKLPALDSELKERIVFDLKVAWNHLNNALGHIDTIRIPRHLTLLSMLFIAPTSFGEKLKYAKAAKAIERAKNTIVQLSNFLTNEDGSLKIEYPLLEDILFAEYDLLISRLYSYKNAKEIGLRIKEIMRHIDIVVSSLEG